MSLSEALLKVKEKSARAYKEQNGSLEGFGAVWQEAEPEMLIIAGDLERGRDSNQARKGKPIPEAGNE